MKDKNNKKNKKKDIKKDFTKHENDNKIKKTITKYKTFECLYMHIHGNTAQITDLILWVLPRHVASKSCIYSILCLFFFACCFVSLYIIALFLFP